MVGIRVTCDYEGCGRHFDVDAATEHRLRVQPYDQPGLRRPAAVFLDGRIECPDSWRVRGARVLCADHWK